MQRSGVHLPDACLTNVLVVAEYHCVPSFEVVRSTTVWAACSWSVMHIRIYIHAYMYAYRHTCMIHTCIHTSTDAHLPTDLHTYV